MSIKMKFDCYHFQIIHLYTEKSKHCKTPPQKKKKQNKTKYTNYANSMSNVCLFFSDLQLLCRR